MTDLTTERTPIEAGLGFLVRTKDRRFTGCDGLVERHDADTAWDMVLLEIETGEVDPFYAHTVWLDARPVGIVTSGAYGHRTGKTLALAYLRDSSARKNLHVSILGKKRRAVILEQPPFDPDNSRLKS